MNRDQNLCLDNPVRSKVICLKEKCWMDDVYC